MGFSSYKFDATALWEPVEELSSAVNPIPSSLSNSSGPTTTGRGVAVRGASVRKPERKICRKEVKATLRRLDLEHSAGDRLTHSWLASKCWRCAACPKLALKLNITRPAQSPQRMQVPQA